MTATSSPQLVVDLTAWPGVVLRVSRNGDVIASNGRLDALLAVDVVGRRVTDLLDADASLRKWNRLVTEGAVSQGPWELIFCSDKRVLDPGAYSILPGGGDQEYWLVEHPAPPRLNELASEVALINAELSTTQRSLVIERARLARALSEVERSNSALDEFAHVVSHDLKAPVRAIRDYAQLLGDNSGPPEQRTGYPGRIAELAERMRRMIDAALEYARAGREASRVEKVDTAELVHQLVAYLAPPADVTIQIASDLPTIETERVPLEQVLRNLLSNAINHRRSDGARIEVTASDAGDCYELTVADNGPGIPESQQERIWRLFHTSRPGEGTGVGLALVKRIVEAHQGTVRVRSSPGQGAAFHVRWPKRPATRA